MKGMPPRLQDVPRLWTAARRAELRERLDALSLDFDARALSTDPLQFVHRYEDPLDQEAAGLIASSLAYGRVAAILDSVEEVLRPLGSRPARVLASLGRRDALHLYAGFRHRFNDGRDIACLLGVIARLQREAGSIGAFFMRGDPGGPTVEGALDRFSEGALARAGGRCYDARTLPPDAGVRFFFPAPRGGSAVKRLNLFLRWMVRRGDGLDLGLWRGIDPARLLVPLDTHVSRIARYLGLTDARGPSWPVVREVTSRLSDLDPSDPVRYDFALSRLGILERCPSRADEALCRVCPLRRVCRHWSARETGHAGGARTRVAHQIAGSAVERLEWGRGSSGRKGGNGHARRNRP
jgi:uncharacterized protein (TIGR02757 family)